MRSRRNTTAPRMIVGLASFHALHRNALHEKMVPEETRFVALPELGRVLELLKKIMATIGAVILYPPLAIVLCLPFLSFALRRVQTIYLDYSACVPFRKSSCLQSRVPTNARIYEVTFYNQRTAWPSQNWYTRTFSPTMQHFSVLLGWIALVCPKADTALYFATDSLENTSLVWNNQSIRSPLQDHCSRRVDDMNQMTVLNLAGWLTTAASFALRLLPAATLTKTAFAQCRKWKYVLCLRWAPESKLASPSQLLH